MSLESWLQFSKGISYVGLFLVFVSTVATSILSAKVDKIKDKRIDTLVQGNNEFLRKINIYQDDLKKKEQEIEDLQTAAKKAQRGISSTYDYKGTKRDIKPAGITATVGDELAVFQKMQQLEKERRWRDLVNVCTEQIQKTPTWYTPYLFRGIAYANIAELDKAIQDINVVVKNTPGDPEYAHAIDLLRQLQKKG